MISSNCLLLHAALLLITHQAPSLTEDPEVNIPVDLGSGFLSQDGRVTFLTPNNTHIVAHQGSSIKLECRIDKPPNSAMVTWTRRSGSGLELLSVGDYTHVQDSRIAVRKRDNNWELGLTHISMSDAGQYLCQASTHPPQTILSTIKVVDAFSEIQVESSVGSENTRNKKYEYQDEKNSNQKEIFIKKGSQLKLKCELKKATEKPKFIFWYHNRTMINFSPHIGKMVQMEENGWVTVLKIDSVSRTDGGNYTCAPQNIVSDSLMVNIMEEDGTFAAVYKDSVTGAASTTNIVKLLLLFPTLLIRITK